MPVFLSIFRKGPSQGGYCALLYHRGNCAISIQAVLDSHQRLGNKRKPLAIRPLLFSEGLCLAFHWIGLVKNLYSPSSVCSCPPGPALPHPAWGVMSCCPDESKAFCGWARLSSVVSPQLWRLPCLLLFSKRLTLTLSAAAGTFENNCLHDCYFSYLFEEV